MTATKDRAKAAPDQDDAAQRGSREFFNRLREDLARDRERPWLKNPIPWSARDVRHGIAEFGGEFKYDPFEYSRHERLGAWFAVMDEIDRACDPEELLTVDPSHFRAFRTQRAKMREQDGKPAPAIITPTEVGWIDGKALPPRAWLYAPHYIRGFVSMTVAPGGVGKTSLGMSESLAMVTGKDLLDVMPSEPLNVWYWNGEDPEDEMKRRWAAAIKYHGIKPKDFKGRFYLDSGRDLKIKIATIGNVSNKVRIAKPVVESVIAAIKAMGIDVLHIDPFVSSHTVPENANEAMQAVVEQWAHIANECDCAIVLWHHTRKTGARETTFEDGRGGSAAGDAARGRRALNKMSPAEAKKAGIKSSQRWLYFWVDHTGSSMAPPAEAREWYKLESVNLRNGDDDGLDGDSIGVATAWDYPMDEDADGLDVDDSQAQAIYAAIRAGGPWRASVQAEMWIGVPIARVLGLDLIDKDARKQVASTVADWIKLGILESYTDKHPTQRSRDVGFVRLSDDLEFD